MQSSPKSDVRRSIGSVLLRFPSPAIKQRRHWLPTGTTAISILRPNRDEARAAIVRDYLADREQHPDGTPGCHGASARGCAGIECRDPHQPSGQPSLDAVRRAASLHSRPMMGPRSFAPGDRSFFFLENSRELGVKNGMLGEVKAIERNALHIRLDGAGAKASAEASFVKIPINDYQAIDHGYATTIHKNQGATVDRAFVLASGTMDRHLTYSP